MAASAFRRSFVTAAAFVLCFLATSAVAQQKLPPTGETIDVSIVNVDVFVTDKKGQRVTGLTADDFEIRENGRVQPLTNFAEYRSEASDERATAPYAKRTILFFVERMALPNFHSEPLFERLRRTVRETVRPGDSAAVVFWDYVSAFTLQNFTDDTQKLEAALTEIERESSGSPRRGDYLRTKYFARQFLAGLPADNGVRRQALDQWSMQEESFYSLSRLKRKSDELQALMRSMSDEDGRKIVIFATSEFGIDSVPLPTGNFPVMAKDGDYDTRRYREAVARTANEHGITVYPVYTAGLGWTPSMAANERGDDIWGARQIPGGPGVDYETVVNHTRALDELARETGGLTASGSPEIVRLLPKITEDLSAFYSLAYRTPATGRANARDIVVHAKNEDYVVRSRQRYVEKTDFTRMHDRVIGNLFRPVGGGSIDLHVEIDSIEKVGRSRWSVPLRITVPVRAMSTLSDGQGAFSVYFVTGGVLGVMSDVKQQTRTFSTADFRPEQEHFTYEVTLVFDAATSFVSVGMMDDQSKEYGLKTVELPAFRAEQRAGGE